MSTTAIPSPLNRIIATQRRVQTQHLRARPGKVPVRDPNEDDFYYQERQNNQSMKSPRPQSTGRFDTRKKDQLQTILQKERTKERKERIQAVLIQRLTSKYGVKHLHMISFFVEEFLSTHDADLTTSDLNILEKEVQNAVRLKNIDEQTSARLRKANGDSRNGNNNDNNNNNNNNNNDTKISFNLPQRPPSGKEWQVIQVYQSILDEEKIQQEKDKLKQSKLAFRQSLDHHIQQSKRQSNEEKEAEERYSEYIKKDIVKHEEEERKKKLIQKKKNEDELRIRQQQIEEQRQRSLKQRQEEEEIDQYNLQLAKEKLKQEQEQILLNKLKEKEKHSKIKLENEENKKYKQLLKQKDAEYDYQLMSEYAAKLDKENAEREELFHNKLKEMEIYAKKFENEGAGRIAKEEQLKFEQTLLKEQEKKLKNDLLIEEEKEKMKKLRNQLANEENQKQLLMKLKLKEFEKEQDLLLKKQFSEQERLLHEEKQRQLLEKKLKQEQYRHRLDEQVEELQKVDVNLTGITPIEKGLNSSYLKTIETNPEVLTKVMTRMQFSPQKK